jgi:hypothetical protein
MPEQILRKKAKQEGRNLTYLSKLLLLLVLTTEGLAVIYILKSTWTLLILWRTIFEGDVANSW